MLNPPGDHRVTAIVYDNDVIVYKHVWLLPIVPREGETITLADSFSPQPFSGIARVNKVEHVFVNTDELFTYECFIHCEKEG